MTKFKAMRKGFFWLLSALLLLSSSSVLSAQNIDVSSTPEYIAPGTSHTVALNFDLPGGGIVQLQLFDPSWNVLASKRTEVAAGASSTTITFEVPADAQVGEGFIWNGLLFDSDREKLAESFADVEIVGDYVGMSNVPLQVETGNTCEIEVEYVLSGDGIIQLQLFDTEWNIVASPWKKLKKGSGKSTFAVEIPATTGGDDFLWQGVVYDLQWNGKYSRVVDDVVVVDPNTQVKPPPVAPRKTQ